MSEEPTLFAICLRIAMVLSFSHVDQVLYSNFQILIYLNKNCT